jgi:tetratricopeptide (TPR) repeat protein
MTQLPSPRLEPLLARYRQAPESRLFAPLADIYRAGGQTDEAIRLLRAGLERHPRYVAALVLLGLCYVEMQQDETAEAVFARVLELDAENLVALRYRAERARQRGALERAQELLRHVLEIDPFDRQVQADLGLLTTALERRGRETPLAPAAGAAVPPPPVAPVVPPPPAVAAFPPPPAETSAAAAPDTSAAGTRPGAPIAPPPIDLRRVGQPERPAAEPPSAAPAPPADLRWQTTRDEDRFVVAPAEGPVRGPIRSVADKLWWEQQAGRAPDAAPAADVRVPPAFAAPAGPGSEPPAAPIPSAPQRPEDQLATLTLARIFESQGYLQKALSIYDELLRKHPGDAEIAAGLAALQRRLAGLEAPPPAPPAPAAPVEEPGVAWRLVDPSTLGDPSATADRLRQATEAARDQERKRRHTLIGAPPAPEPPAPAAAEPPPAPRSREDVSRGHADFQRFLAYVRSLKP